MEINFDKKPRSNGCIVERRSGYYLANFPLGRLRGGKTLYVNYTKTGIPTINGDCKGWSCDTLLQALQKQQEAINFRDEVYKKRTLVGFHQEPPLAKALLEYYNRYMRGDHSSAQTRNKYLCWVKTQVAPFFNDLTVVDIDPDMLQDFINKQVSERNYREVQPLIKRYFKWATAKGIVTHNVAELTSIPKQIEKERKKRTKRTKYVPTSSEMKVFFQYVAEIKDPSLKKFIVPTLILVETGMRIGEVLALQWDDIDLQNCVIRVNKSWDSKTSKMTSGKNDFAQRFTAFSPTLAPIILEHKNLALFEGKRFILESSSGTPVQYKYFREFFSVAANKVGLPKNFTPHSTRHWWCSVMAQENPHDVQKVAKQAGHSDLRMMMTRYAIHDTKKETIRLKDDLFRRNSECIVEGEFLTFP